MGEPPVLSVEGKEYPLRKLGLLDIERLSSIVRKVSRSIDVMALSSVEDLTPKAMIGFLIDFMPYASDEIIRFMASVIRLKPGMPFEDAEEKLLKSKSANPQDPNEGTIRDPSVFPLGSEVKLIGLLSEHPDVLSFFTASRELANNPLLKKLKDRLGALSTESNTDTDGPTSTSSEDTSEEAATD